MNFMDGLTKELGTETQLTENGAVGFTSTGKNLLDMNFRVSSYRNMTPDQIFTDFMRAYNDDSVMAMRWLFYVRDIRGGLGERRLFRAIMTKMANTNPSVAVKVVPLFGMFGRWDDLFDLFETPLREYVLQLIVHQLNTDTMAAREGKGISLLAKWMPSINCSNPERKKLAKFFVKRFGITEKIYRGILTDLRTQLGVVEQKMSANEWAEINYKAVPSRANLMYNPAFLKHDEERRRAFLEKVVSGEEKIHGGTNFPHDILTKYRSNYLAEDTTLEVLWKALPNYGEGMESTIVVADGSGSMCSAVGGTRTSALDVANSLAIYFAERCTGQFKNKYITFSEKPQLVNLGDGSLFSKIYTATRHNEVANTNIQAVFELILDTAVRNKMKQEDLPGTVLVISDMEFDSCTTTSNDKMDPYFYRSRRASGVNDALFEVLKRKFVDAGYKMPKLAFWNVMGRTLTVPAVENELGVTLISGFSPAAINMVLCGEADPYKALVKILLDPKYDVVEKALAIK